MRWMRLRLFQLVRILWPPDIGMFGQSKAHKLGYYPLTTLLIYLGSCGSPHALLRYHCLLFFCKYNLFNTLQLSAKRISSFRSGRRGRWFESSHPDNINLEQQRGYERRDRKLASEIGVNHYPFHTQGGNYANPKVHSARDRPGKGKS